MKNGTINTKKKKNNKDSLITSLAIGTLLIIFLIMSIVIWGEGSQSNNQEEIAEIQKGIPADDSTEKERYIPSDFKDIVKNNYKILDDELFEIAINLTGKKAVSLSGNFLSRDSFIVDTEASVLYFGATFCPSCAEFAETIDTISRESDLPIYTIYLDKTNEELHDYVKENHSNNLAITGNDELNLTPEQIKSEFQLKLVPTVVFIKDGAIEYVHFGSIPEDLFSTLLEEIYSN